MKYIFVTGGVVSSVGKGLSAAALGYLLEQHQLRVQLQKFDPYLNIDSSNLNPLEHGEIYLLRDGTDCDLDLGHYERFTQTMLKRRNSISAGRIYESVLQKERNNEYHGATIQVIPHVVNEIKHRFTDGAQEEEIDVLITEIGGTSGDIEVLPFLEAVRQFILEVGKENALLIHLTLIPYLKASEELKTKPTQQSIAKLREIGLQPDLLLCRTEQPLEKEIRAKLSLFCNLPEPSVLEEKDVSFSIYELPLELHKEKLNPLVIEKLKLQAPPIQLQEWENFVYTLKNAQQSLRIGLLTKYVSCKDAHKSLQEALTHAGVVHQSRIELIRIDSETLTEDQFESAFQKLNGMICAGNENELIDPLEKKAIAYLRQSSIPCLGIDFSFRLLLEQALEQNKTQVGDLLGEQKTYIVPKSKLEKIYASEWITERFRQRKSWPSSLTDALKSHGLQVAALNEQKDKIQAVEDLHHPWFVAVGFHPEFNSKPLKANPLFVEFIQQAKKGVTGLVS